VIHNSRVSFYLKKIKCHAYSGVGLLSKWKAGPTSFENLTLIIFFCGAFFLYWVLRTPGLSVLHFHLSFEEEVHALRVLCHSIDHRHLLH
jgi:hypothetical protein